MDKDGARPTDQALASQAQGLGPSGFDPSRWAEVPFSAGNRYARGIWTVERSHDERDNFYTVYRAGEEMREYRNDLEAAVRWANDAIAIEAQRAATGNTDAVEDESAGAESASPNPNPVGLGKEIGDE